jgi:hypothetical protein
MITVPAAVALPRRDDFEINAKLGRASDKTAPQSANAQIW